MQIQYSQETLLLVFTLIVAVAVLLQAIVLFGILLASKKTASQLLELGEELRHIGEDLRSTAVPVFRSAHRLIEDTSPKIRQTTENLAEVSEQLRAQAGTIGRTLDELAGRTRVQAERMDHMVTGVLDSVDSVTRTVRHSVSAPVRQLSGILSGIRAGIDTFRGKPKPAPADKDMFI